MKYPYKDKAKKNGLIGELVSYRINGKTYDSNGEEISDKHEEDCVCCCKNLLKANK